MAPVIGLIASLGSKVIDIIDQHVKDKALKQQLTLEIQKQYTEHLAKIEEILVQKQGDIIVSEATGHSWLQRNWRPITMLVFVFIIANNYVLVPYGQAFGLHLPLLNLPDQVWELIKYGLTGYIGARSVEKISSIAAQTKMVSHIAKSATQTEAKRVPKLTDFNLTLDNEE